MKSKKNEDCEHLYYYLYIHPIFSFFTLLRSRVVLSFCVYLKEKEIRSR